MVLIYLVMLKRDPNSHYTTGKENAIKQNLVRYCPLYWSNLGYWDDFPLVTGNSGHCKISRKLKK